MKKLSLFCLVLTLFLSACSSYRYGVPLETWDRMSESERIEAMGVYERDQQARRQAAEERARQQAMERERERARQTELKRARQERIEAIHRGEGAYGELLRVRLQGGRIKVGDRHHRYEPVTFTIADNETRGIGVADHKGREVFLNVTYSGGALSMEGIRFPYDRSWGRGRLYADTGTSGALELRGVDVFIEVHSRSSRYERELPRLVIIREEPPPAVVSRETDNRRPPLHQPAATAAKLPPQLLEVVILAGEMKVRGHTQQVERVTLRLAEGENRNIAVTAGSAATTLSLRYRKGELFIDDTPAKRHDTVRLPFEKEWNTGKIYRLDLKGGGPLEKLEVKVTGIEGREQKK